MASTETQPNNWWQRNLKWLVPVLALLMLAGAAFLAVFSILMTGIKSSVVYQQAVEQAITNKVLLQRLGSPIRPGALVTGEITHHRTVGETSQSTGEAQLKIPVRGPQGKASLYVEATTRDGETWTLRRLEAAVKGDGERVNLLESSRSQ